MFWHVRLPLLRMVCIVKSKLQLFCKYVHFHYNFLYRFTQINFNIGSFFNVFFSFFLFLIEKILIYFTRVSCWSIFINQRLLYIFHHKTKEVIMNALMIFYIFRNEICNLKKSFFFLLLSHLYIDLFFSHSYTSLGTRHFVVILGINWNQNCEINIMICISLKHSSKPCFFKFYHYCRSNANFHLRLAKKINFQWNEKVLNQIDEEKNPI